MPRKIYLIDISWLFQTTYNIRGLFTGWESRSILIEILFKSRIESWFPSSCLGTILSAKLPLGEGNQVISIGGAYIKMSPSRAWAKIYVPKLELGNEK